MKLGVAMFPTDYAVRPDALARMVEERGFESLFFPEHTHIPASAATRDLMAGKHGTVDPRYSHTHDLFVALAYAAAATRSLLIGAGILLVPERDPIATAKAVASLDVLSGGRVLLGVGAGWIPEETANHGVEPSRRWAVMAERVKAMRRIWTEEAAEFHGEHVAFDPIHSWPKPLRPGRPPVLVGGEGKGVLSRVLDFGDEWMPHAGMPVETLAARMAELRERARAAGRRGDIPVTVFGAEPTVEALQALRAIGVRRAVVYAPAAEADEVRAFLDGAAPLVSAVADG